MLNTDKCPEAKQSKWERDGDVVTLQPHHWNNYIIKKLYQREQKELSLSHWLAYSVKQS
jgi:sulfur relay (sulfurtransferase) DsrC/TusE family protein